MNINTNNYYMNQAYRTQASYSTETVKGSGSYFEVTGGLYGNKYAQGSDSVELSTEVQDAIDRIKNLDVFSCIFPDNNPTKPYKSLDEVENDFMSDFKDFSSAFGMMGSAFGMSGSDSISMGLDGKGGMNITGSDPALAGKFAGAFGNETMTARFAVMAARASLADAGYTVDGFKDAYAQDPVKAIEDNIDALKERLLGFRTTGSGGTMQYGFERPYDYEYSKTTVNYETESTTEVA